MKTVPCWLSLALFSKVIKFYGIYLLRITRLSTREYVITSVAVKTSGRMYSCHSAFVTHRFCNLFNNKGSLQTTDENSHWRTTSTEKPFRKTVSVPPSTRVGTLIVATIYLQLIQNRYMFRSFTVLHCSHQRCVQPVASDVEVVVYL